MSADNWTVCPKCGADRETMREDYDIGIESDEFEVDFRASCVQRLGGCGFSYSFKWQEKVQ